MKFINVKRNVSCAPHLARFVLYDLVLNPDAHETGHRARWSTAILQRSSNTHPASHPGAVIQPPIHAMQPRHASSSTRITRELSYYALPTSAPRWKNYVGSRVRCEHTGRNPLRHYRRHILPHLHALNTHTTFTTAAVALVQRHCAAKGLGSSISSCLSICVTLQPAAACIPSQRAPPCY